MTLHANNSSRKAYEAALRKKILIRKPCEVCGDEKVDGHHPDYSKPLDVIWLCRKHHLQWHSKYGFPESLDNLHNVPIDESLHRLLKTKACECGLLLKELTNEIILNYLKKHE